MTQNVQKLPLKCKNLASQFLLYDIFGTHRLISVFRQAICLDMTIDNLSGDLFAKFVKKLWLFIA